MPKDSRHLHRIAIVKEIFSSLFVEDFNESEISEVGEILTKKVEIDAIIAKYASKYSGDKLAKIDASILYLAIWELLFDPKKIPYKVAINEAIELAKTLGSETSAAFVNALLGKVYESYLKPNESKS